MMVVKLRGKANSSLQPGFALIEMIGVIAIMAILAGAMAPFLLNQIDNSDADAEQLALEAIAEGIRQYYRDETVPANYGNLPDEVSWTAVDVTDDNSNWQEQLVPDYLSGSVFDTAINKRQVARFYASSYADITATPRVTILSHLLVGGASPTGMDITCVGAAQAAEDPCGDSVAGATLDDDMPSSIANGLIKVVNLNLAKERSAIIERVKSRYLAPAVEAFETLENDVCQGIVDSTFAAPTNLSGVTEVAGAGLEFTDFWSQRIKVSKFTNRIVVWSDGPLGAGVTPGDDPSNPLYLTASCAPGSDLQEQLDQISASVVGTMLAQVPGPISLPANLIAAGVSAEDDDDPWGEDINLRTDQYSLAGVLTAEVGSFVIWSNGPDGADDLTGGDDVVLSRRTGEISGVFGAYGRSYVTAMPPSPSLSYDCDSLEINDPNWLETNCSTVLDYLLNASACNVAVAHDQECTVAGY